MRTNFAIAALIYPMVQAVLFGTGLGLLLVLHLATEPVAVALMVVATFAAAVPAALVIAPLMRSARWREMHPHRWR